jgi:hypothetical protein
LSKQLENIEQMKIMHKMYANIAKSLIKPLKPSSRSSSPAKKKKTSFSSSAYESQDESAVPAHGNSATKTRMKLKKKSSKSQKSSSSAATGAVSGDELYLSDFDGDRHSKMQFTPSQSQPQGQGQYRYGANSHQENDLEYEDYSKRHDVQAYLNQGSSTPNTRTSSSAGAASNTNTVSYHTSSEGGSTAVATGGQGSGENMNKMISLLEEEFNLLNLQYRNLLTNVQASNSNTSIPGNGVPSNPENIQKQAEEIVGVIQKLHQKGEQLRLLKSPTK